MYALSLEQVLILFCSYPKVNDEERRAEQRKYGVFFDDDYDYLQHLKEPSGPSELIPTSAWSAHSRREEKEETLVIPVSLFHSCK